MVKRKYRLYFKPFFFSLSDVGENGDAPFIRRRIGKENHASYVVSINSSIKNQWYEPARDIIDCLSVLRFAAHFATRTNRAIKDLFASTMDLNAQSFCIPDLIAQMAKLLVIQDNVAQMANYVAQMSQLHVIRDNRHTIPVCLPNSNGAGADTPEQNSHDAGSELFQAASSGNVSMAQALLSATGTQSYINYTDGHGHASLLVATKQGHTVIVSQLITARCDVNLRCGYGSQNASLAFSMVSRSPCPPNLSPCLRCPSNQIPFCFFLGCLYWGILYSLPIT